MSIVYKAVTTLDKDGIEHYGIGVFKYYDDVFKTKGEAERFADLCNKCTLSDIHFEEVIFDYLNK